MILGSGDKQRSTESVHLLDGNAQFYVTWTKLTVPQQSSKYLRRSRLIDQIHQVIDRKLLLVRAPAGYGKTSLLVDLAHESDMQVCWYTVEEQDADLRAFLTYLLTSIARRFPSFGHRSVRMLQTLGDQVHTNLRVFVATLVNEILNTVPEYFFLVLDDYHTLGEDATAHEFIEQFVDLMPEQCHLVISSRTVPPLPLVRLMARQQMAAIGVDELRFTEQEIHQLSSRKFGIALSTDQVRFLAEQTDGWITALWLGANIGWDTFLNGDVSPTSGLTETGIYDYLMSEVFEYQPQEVKDFLLKTAVLQEMPIPLCDELVGQDCYEMLHQLEKYNLFVSRLEEVGIEPAYKYHPLFREFLVSRLKQQHAQLYRELNIQAADIFAKRENWQATILHDLNAGRYDRVRQTILTHYDELNRAGLRESIAHWIDLLPPEHVSPHLQIRRAMWATYLGQVDTALRLYANAIVLFEAQENNLDLARALTERSYALSRIGHYSEAMQDCEQALELVEHEANADRLRGLAYRYLGRFYGETGDPRSSLKYLNLARECWTRDPESSVQMARLVQDIGVAYEMQGQLATAVQQFHEALSAWEELGNDGEVAFTLNNIGVVQHRRGEYHKALNMLDDALHRSRSAGYVRAEAYTLASLGDLCRDLSQYDEAVEFYEEAQQKAEAVGEAYLGSYIDNAYAEALRLGGHMDSAHRAVEHALSQDVLPKSMEARHRLTLSAALLGQQDTQRAKQELHMALSLSGKNQDIAFRCHTQLAQAAMLEGRPQDTIAHLHEAFQLAEEAGLAQSLSVESLNYIEVLEFAAEQGDESPELIRWIAAAKELERVRKTLGRTRQAATPSAQYPTLQIHAFGGSSVLQDGTAVSWRTSQAKELFFYLLACPNGQTKEQIGATIWPDHSTAKLFSIFRSSLFRVRKALFSDVILYEDDQYRLSPYPVCRYDVREFEQLMSKGDLSDNPVQKAFHYRRASESYRGAFLADLYADWILPLREALQARYLYALRYLAEFHLEGARYPQAIEYTRKILLIDEYYEAAYYLLIQAYARSGQRPKARRIYGECRDMLAEFGLVPQRSWEELCR